MKEQVVTFEVANLAKEKGFDWQPTLIYDLSENPPILNFYGEVIGDFELYAPTQSLLQKWIREKHGIHILLIPTITGDWAFKTISVLSERDNDVIKGIIPIEDLPLYDNISEKDFSTYEEALEKGLLESLKLIKNG